MKLCPECDAKIDLDISDMEDGDCVVCASCNEELEIVFLDGGGYVLESTLCVGAGDSSHFDDEDEEEQQIFD